MDLGRDPLAPVVELLDSVEFGLVLPFTDDRHVSVPALLAGRVFTHRLTATEVDRGFLSTPPDLEALSMLTDSEDGCRLVDGSEIVELLPDFHDDVLAERGIDAEEVSGAAWLLPPGLLSGLGLTAGSLVGVSLEPAGLAVTSTIPGDVPGQLVSQLRAWTERARGRPGAGRHAVVGAVR
ncbi:MAG: hypothetical protein ABR549_05765 [Mycobacteriales bacterium]